MVSADPVQSTIINSNTAQTIPSEIIQYILHFITQPTDLLNCALTCKSWSFHAMELLWFKPQFNQLLQWKTFCEILSCEQQSSTSSSSSSLSTSPSLPSKTAATTTTKTLTFPYAAFIRRINLSSLSEHVTNTQLAVLKTCYRLERITLIGCTSITDDGLLELLSSKAGKYIMSIDLSDVTNITDKAIIAIANRCSRLQGLNLSMCKEDNKKCSGVTDIGIVALAKKCRQLRRIKLNNCDKLTDVSALALARYCPRLLEIDCPVTDNAMIEIFTRLKELREFRLQQHESISDIAFEPLSGFFSDLLPLPDSLDNDTHFTTESYDNQFGNNQNTTTTSEENDHNDSDATTKKNIAATSGHTDNNNDSNNYNNNNNNSNNNNSNNSDTSNNNNIRQISKSSFHRTLNNAGYYEQLRVLDLTNASYITDEAIRCIVHAAPKVRNLLLNKCKEITDKGISYICQLERYLHYLHLGHCERLTDQAIIELSEKCTRIRYLDLGQCTLLTDESVKGLAKLPRLKRIGLVKCFNITDIAIDYLISEPRIANSLERVHLSYCIQLTKKSIQKLLNFCQRLNHLSLTSVPDFTRPEIQRYRRVPPKNFTTQQQNAFCVFSGNGVNELRKYLNDNHNSNHNSGTGNSSSNNLDQHHQQQLQQQQQSLLNTRNQTLLQVLANRSTSQTSPSSSTSTSYRSSPTNNNRQLPSSTITSSTLMNDFNQININTLTPSLVLPSTQPIAQEVEVVDEDEDESMNGDEQLMD